MITGFNTDIAHQGRIYHVQTEDRGKNNPIVETLVYSSGEILTSRKTPYTDLIETKSNSDSEILKRMEAQHKDLIQEIRTGKFDAGDLKPFGHGIVSNRSLDEVAQAFLAEHIALEEIKLALNGSDDWAEGESPKFELQVVEQNTERPVCGATVEIRLVATGEQPRQLFSASTDEAGCVEAAFDIPSMPGGNAAIVCSADAAGKTAELKRLVQKPT